MSKMSLAEYTREFVDYMVNRLHPDATPDAVQGVREYAEKTAPTYFEEEGPFRVADPAEAAELDMSYWDA